MTPIPTLATAGIVTALFTGSNEWMVSLGPIFALGGAISIAIALLGLVVYLITTALQNARKGFGK